MGPGRVGSYYFLASQLVISECSGAAAKCSLLFLLGLLCAADSKKVRRTRKGLHNLQNGHNSASSWRMSKHGLHRGEVQTDFQSKKQNRTAESCAHPHRTGDSDEPRLSGHADILDVIWLSSPHGGRCC